MLTPIMRPILQPVMANLDYDYGDNFSPAALFTTGKKGFWYKPNDIGTIYQDASGSTAGAVDSPVGKVMDLSGFGNHAIQSTSTARPTLKTINGKNVLASDFVDDYMDIPAIGEDVDVYINTPYGNYVSQLDGVASRIPLNYPCEIVAVNGLTTQQKAALKNYFKTEEKYLVLVDGNTTLNNFRYHTGGATTDITFTGANGVSVVKSLSANTDASFDFSVDGLTGPVVMSIPMTNKDALLRLLLPFNALVGYLPILPDGFITAYFHSAQFTGSIPKLPSSAGIMQANSNQLSSVANATVSAMAGTYYAHNNLLPQSSVDEILAAFVAAGRNSGTMTLNIGGTGNAAPSAAGAADKATLISRGWTVTTN